MKHINKIILSVLGILASLLLVTSCSTPPEAKIEKVYHSFTEGPKKRIPSSAFSGAKGVAVLSGWKAGALIAMQRTKGYVMSTGGSVWSNPPAIAGRAVDYQLQLGGAKVDIVLILNTSRAEEAFKSGEYFKLGKQLSYSPGPQIKSDGSVTDAVRTDVWYYSKMSGAYTPATIHSLYIIPLKNN